MTIKQKDDHNEFQTFTKEQLAEIKESIRLYFYAPTERTVPENIRPDDIAGLIEFLSSPESPEEARSRYRQLPTAQHMVVASAMGRINILGDARSLFAYWVNHWSKAPAELLDTPGLHPIRRAIQDRAIAARNLIPELPSLEVMQSLWVLDVSSPTGLASARTGKVIKGELVNGDLNVAYRPIDQAKERLPSENIVKVLEDALTGDQREAYLAAKRDRRNTYPRKEKQPVTKITPEALEILNETFPTAGRMALVSARLMYNSTKCEFRSWDPVNRKVMFDTDKLLADMENKVGYRFAMRFKQGLERGLTAADMLCTHLMIPMQRGTLIFPKPISEASLVREQRYNESAHAERIATAEKSLEEISQAPATAPQE
ncbi:hypothetical protein I9018_13930 [Pseudomonas sp. MPFS]|uniref:hypothetical protein n=1 Tax=Pseudomonas sp. MPFS TaxID=2795724 RepID=UPI001F14308F|nr:hypothetical protein [Pseudomonas sp. MPFS]UMZ14723.1 hypothetical protein I9018_13930 [Pseudomonas sp. MPFS]